MSKKLLSKTHIKMGLQCRLALHKLFNKTDTPDYGDSKGLLEKGKEVNHILHTVMSHGVKIESDNNLEKLIQTQEAIKGGATTLFEATFKTDEAITQADLLEKNDDGTWDLTEVKSSSSSANSLKKKKKEYIQDATIQYHVISKTLKIKNVNVWVVNKEYLYDGKEYTTEFFHKIDITDEVEDLAQEMGQLILNTRSAVEDLEPTVKIGSQCNSPHDCPFKHTCWKKINETDLMKIPSLRNKPALFHKGIESADHEYFDEKGNQMAVAALRKNGMQLNLAELKRQLEMIKAYDTIDFLDFEGLNHPVPLFKNTTPYEQIPFQYSIHRRGLDGAISHKECLASGKVNPSEEIAEQLAKDIEDSEILLVYYKTYEIGVLKYLAERYPQHSETFLGAISKIHDLYDVVKKCVYHPDFSGSYSLKKVAPALIGEKARWEGELDNGAEAADIYVQAIHSFDDEKEAIFKELLIYCNQDTMNLVYLLEYLESLVS